MSNQAEKALQVPADDVQVLSHAVPQALTEAVAPADYVDLAAAQLLTELASTQRPGERSLLALDCHSDNQSSLVNHHLTGVLASSRS